MQDKKFGSRLKGFTLDLTPLRELREFRLLYIGQAVSSVGTMMTYVVIPWQMYQLTKSTLLVGLIGIAEFVPMFFAAFMGGALADTVDRRRLIIWTEIALTLVIAVLCINSLLAAPRVWVLFVAAALKAALNGLQRPAREALTPRLVPPEYITAVGALNSARMNLASIGGRAVGGILAVSIGTSATYAIDVVSYAASLVTLFMLSPVPPLSKKERPSLRAVVEGVRYARSRPELLGTYLIDINAMFFGMPMALFPAMAESFGTGASVGWMYAMPAVGALLVSLTSGWAKHVQRHGLAVVIAASVWGVFIIGFGLAKSLWLALLCLALAGGADEISALFRMTIWNQTIPDYLRGRLASIEMISYLTGPKLGDAEAGLVAARFSVQTSVVSGGILCVVGSLILAALMPAFVAYDARAGIRRKETEEAARLAAQADDGMTEETGMTG